LQLYTLQGDGEVSVTASSEGPASLPIDQLLAGNSVRIVTKPESNSWAMVDFRDKRVAATHYALRHYSSWNTEALRSWTLSASSDGTWCE
jgi:hypothetical protein